MRRISRAGRGDRNRATAGFTLLEVVCVVAIVGMMAAVLLPAFADGTSRSRLKGYAIEIASLLTADRTAAIRGHVTVMTRVDANGRAIRSGASDQTVALPADVVVTTALAARCNGRPAGATIVFFASGMSCGGVLTIARPSGGYAIQVNWLTGAIEIVGHHAT